MPDYQRLPKYHCKSVFDTSLYDDNNKTRETDDWQLSVDNKEQIDTFCNKFIVEENLVKDSLEHLIIWDEPKQLGIMIERGWRKQLKTRSIMTITGTI